MQPEETCPACGQRVAEIRDGRPHGMTAEAHVATLSDKLRFVMSELTLANPVRAKKVLDDLNTWPLDPGRTNGS